jgi:hypothetical protein
MLGTVQRIADAMTVADGGRHYLPFGDRPRPVPRWPRMAV